MKRLKLVANEKFYRFSLFDFGMLKTIGEDAIAFMETGSDNLLVRCPKKQAFKRLSYKRDVPDLQAENCILHDFLSLFVNRKCPW